MRSQRSMMSTRRRPFHPLAIALVVAFVAAPSWAYAEPAKYGPTISLAAAVENDEVFFHSWAGVARYHMGPGSSALFLSAGLEIDVRGWETSAGPGTLVDFRPTLRAGWAPWTVGDHVVIPLLSIYGLAGLHPASELRPASARLGVGLSSPALLAVGTSCEALVPSMIELTADISAGDTITGLRLGWNI